MDGSNLKGRMPDDGFATGGNRSKSRLKEDNALDAEFRIVATWRTPVATRIGANHFSRRSDRGMN